jgi:hypothetical protein
VGKSEVVALIARLVTEGKLESEVVSGDRGKPTMALRLNAARSVLHGYERTLVDGLFFDGRSETRTDLVKERYGDTGYDPARAIGPELKQAAQQFLPAGDAPRTFRRFGSLLSLMGLVLIAAVWYRGEFQSIAVLFLGIGLLVFSVVGAFVGSAFRAHINWGRKAAAACLIPSVSIAGGAAAFLWFYAGTGAIDVPALLVLAIASFALGLTVSAIESLKSRQSREAVAIRRHLAAGRAFFVSELEKERPALRDAWYPWLLAFGLHNQADDWSARHPSGQGDRDSVGIGSSAPSSGGGSPSGGWTGFGGGHSGGAGGGTSWAAAAGGLAAGVAAPSSSSSGGGGSSSGGSSGGGGGGGW